MFVCESTNCLDFGAETVKAWKNLKTTLNHFGFPVIQYLHFSGSLFHVERITMTFQFSDEKWFVPLEKYTEDTYTNKEESIFKCRKRVNSLRLVLFLGKGVTGTRI